MVAEVVNAVNASKAGRKLLDAALGVDQTAPIPRYHSNTGSKRARKLARSAAEVKPGAGTTGRVALFVTCYGDRNEPHLPEDLTAVFGFVVGLAVVKGTWSNVEQRVTELFHFSFDHIAHPENIAAASGTTSNNFLYNVS